MVALLAEGVDRNKVFKPGLIATLGSPSSRRAWIEITHGIVSFRIEMASPSSRRAWIEIL